MHQQQNDTLGSIGPVMNLAINYFETKRYAECEALFRRYTPYIDRLDDYSKSEFLINKATLEINTQLTATTEKDLDESLRLKKQIGHSLGVANVLIKYSEFYHQKGDFRKANRYCYEALALSEELKALKKLGQVYDNLFFNYAVLNTNDSAQKYRSLYTALYDTMFAEAKARAFSREQVAFKTFEKEKENLGLMKENTLIRSKNQLIIFASVFVICLLVVSSLFYLRIKKQKDITRQKEIMHQLIFETEQAERARIARDLHDSVGQKLSVVKMQMSLNKPELNSQTMDLLDNAIKDVRTVSHDLFPNDLGKGLVAAIEEMADDINYTSNKTKIHLSLRDSLVHTRFSKQTELY
ncbi:MAG: histidine kinase, partial [Bacteroidia bacterium]|nr:histidine kinase [Bacteroidia bacterium]